MPFDVQTHAGLLRIRLFGSLSSADLRGLADAVLDAEARHTPMPGRVSDLTGVTAFETGFRDMLEFVGRRRGMRLPNPIRSAIVVANDVQLGVARMFQTLNDHPQVTVRIFHDMDAALAWLADGTGAHDAAADPPGQAG